MTRSPIQLGILTMMLEKLSIPDIIPRSGEKIQLLKPLSQAIFEVRDKDSLNSPINGFCHHLMPSKDPIVILGVDPGTRITGYGVIVCKDSKTHPIDFGCIRPPLRLPYHDRYLAIFEALELLIERHSPDALAVETQFVHRNAQSALKLGIARGMAILAASRKKIPIFEYAPKKTKLAVVGQGTASKTQVQRMIQLLLQLPSLPKPEDAADALAVAICHAHTLAF